MSVTVTGAKIGVVVPVRNRKEKTLRFLERFSRQTHPNRLLILVDSHSTDGTPDAVRSAYPDAVVLAATDEDYWTGATNIGVRHALGAGCDYVFTINDDSICSEWLLEQLAGVAARYDLPILGCRIDYLDSPGKVWSIGASHAWGTADLFKTGYGGVWVDELPALVRSALFVPVESMPGNGVLVHRRVFEQIGLYWERFAPHYHADTEFMLRAGRHGFVPSVCPQLVVYNDFDVPEPTLKGWKGALGDLRKALLTKRSPWFLLPHLAIVVRYAPVSDWFASWAHHTYRVYRFCFAGVGVIARARGLGRRLRRRLLQKGNAAADLPLEQM